MFREDEYRKKAENAGILHLTAKVVYTFLMTNLKKWAFHIGKCKAVNETCQNAVENLAMVRHCTKPIEARKQYEKEINIKRLKAGWDDSYLIEVLGVNDIYMRLPVCIGHRTNNINIPLPAKKH